jgi:SAM-dependent methyltransferase
MSKGDERTSDRFDCLSCMTSNSTNYRWNSSAAAEAYDAAAPSIHPCYEKVQNQILDLLPFKGDAKLELVDLGAGSGRLAERVLTHFPRAQVSLIDQSEPFLGIAERRLAEHAGRTAFLQHRLQDDWSSALDSAPSVIVSTSAIHHLEPAEKQSVFVQCFDSLAPGGVFVNGDEYRPADDQEYLALNEWWWSHMNMGLNDGRIPETFRATLTQWHDRNITRFAEPKKSGDDCLETAPIQLAYLRSAGFASADLVWSEKLWGVIIARKSTM